MKTTPPKIPHPFEWDFRAVSADALPVAVLYEYARASAKIREAACRWLETKSGGKTIRARLIAAHNKHNRHAMNREKVKAWNGFERAKLPWQLFALLTKERPDFPTPWLAAPLRFKRNAKFSRVRVDTVANTADEVKEICAECLQGGKPIGEAEYLRAVHGSKFIVDIEWPDATVEEITADFKKWLAREAKRHPEMKPAGKRGQAPVEPLKWLAAYRLANAGLTFPQVKALLPVYVSPADAERQQCARMAGLNLSAIPKAPKFESGCGLLPEFADKSGFSDAIAIAKRKLAELESGKFESWLLNAAP